MQLSQKKLMYFLSEYMKYGLCVAAVLASYVGRAVTKR